MLWHDSKHYWFMAQLICWTNLIDLQYSSVHSPGYLYCQRVGEMWLKWSAPTVGLQLKTKHQQHGDLGILLIAATAAQLHLVANYLIKTNLKNGPQCMWHAIRWYWHDILSDKQCGVMRLFRIGRYEGVCIVAACQNYQNDPTFKWKPLRRGC